MSSTLGLPNQYDSYQVVIATVASVYASLFVMISNHYVFKPKLQQFFLQSFITSKAFYQFLIDFLTNLTQLTFVASSLLLIGSDDSLSVMIYSDMSWCGLLLAIVSFRGLQIKTQPNSRLLMLKNIVFLLMVYAVIVMHYSMSILYVSLGLGMVGLYLINLMLNGMEQKFLRIMQELFGYKPDREVQQDYDIKGYALTPEYLCRNFPVTPADVMNKLKTHDRHLRDIKLDTRRSMAQTLLKISLAVQLSRQKLLMKEQRDIKNYYGMFHGTVTSKSRKLINKQTTKDQQNSQSELQQRSVQEALRQRQMLFCIFPVKIFENNKTISVIFSLVINLGLGFLISVAVDMASTLNKGYYLHIIYGFLLLPLVPAISKEEFLNSMTLSTLWKYCLYGIFLTINCIGSTSTFSFNSQLIFAPVFQFIGLIIVTNIALSYSNASYSIIFVWLAAIGASCLMIFEFC